MAQCDTGETTNYYRLISLVVNIGSDSLRDVLLFKIKPDPLGTVLHRYLNLLNGLLQRRVLYQDQYNLLTKPIPDANDFDISLLYVLFRNNICPNVVPPLQGWNTHWQNLNALDYSLGAELLRMTGMRNKIAHRPLTQVGEQEFEDMWNELEGIIDRIARHGSPDKRQDLKKKIDELKVRPLDTSRIESLEALRIWQNQEQSAILYRLESHTEESKAKTEEFQTKLMQEVLEVKDALNKQNQPVAPESHTQADGTDKPIEGMCPNLDDNTGDDEPLCIVTREEWKGRPAKQFDDMITPVPIVFIHHTAWNELDSPEACCQEMRRLQDFHMVDKGWDDIGYNFVIGGDGRVYEGRGWDRVGAHTKGWNSISVSFAVMGDFRDHLPNLKVLSTMRRLMDLGVTVKKLTEDYKMYGHRDASQTMGPGEKLYNEIKGWKRYGPGPPKKVTII